MTNNNVLIKDLVDFGLSEKEALVYISLLELEVAPANIISKKAGTNRSSTYVVLDSLKEKGLVGTTDKEGVQNFVASSPEVLLRSARELRKKYADIESMVEGFVPELKALYKDTEHKPKVKIFEGEQGLISGFEDTLKCKEKVLRTAASVDIINGLLPKEYLQDYVKRRVENGIEIYDIHPNEESSRVLKKKSGSKKTDHTIYIRKDKFKLPTTIAIYANKIKIISKKSGGTCIFIEDEDIAETMKQIFDLAHEGAKKYEESKL